ncbi:cell wall metabolism sensor histidine kinase WalK [Clostridium sp. CAG:265]|uniref:sensor histidine kinase n=2 Tax=Clostridium TaxID=1485 RepID=UPI00033FA93A|nr:HAMP domain-containing sensor histidine kinase [Clostridium sp. CAG:265]CDB74101.1 aTPase/histidine kinase/DNA gyrase B/HSP90 domain protein [Clostridium sp. CAG:265]
MDYKSKLKSINSKLIISFTLIMIVTILSIKLFVNTIFKDSFEKYVDDSNKVEVNHLIEFDLKNLYTNESWNTEFIEGLGIEAIRKGIAIEIYDKNNNKVWSVFEDEKVLSDKTLNDISKNMKSIEKQWDNYFEELKVDINDDEGNILVGYAYIGHYASTYYMENDVEFFNAINRIIIIIGVISISSIIIISIIISRSIAKPISKVSKMTKYIGEGNYKNKLNYKSNIMEIDDLINSINKLSNELNDQENLRKQLTGDIAHELRTPLTSIKGHLDAIIVGIWEPTNERLNSINEEVKRITNLVDELRKLAKFDSGKDNLNKEIVNLKNYIKSIAYNYEGKALEKNIVIKYQLENIEALIDKEKFAQVIINILSNAIKYNNGNNEIYIKVFKKNNSINISIKDSGIGIPKSEYKNIFERFYRLDKSRVANEKGAGVGLTIAKSIVNAHGGEIEVYSEINKGSEFIISLPS